MFWSDLGPKVAYEGIGIIDSKLPTVNYFVKNNASEASSSSSNSSNGGVMPTVNAADLSDKQQDDYSKGVVFYMQNKKIIGIVLWNIFNHINTAREILNQDENYDDLDEVAKLFDIDA